MRFALEMLAETPEKEERERLWQMMEEDLDELDDLIESSLAYSRFEREQPLHLTSVDFSSWLSDEVDSMRILTRDLELLIDMSALPPGTARRTRPAKHALCRNQPATQCTHANAFK